MFRRPIIASIQNAELITKAAVALRNYLRKKSDEGDNYYCPRGFSDTERNGQIQAAQWRRITVNDSGMEGLSTRCNNYSNDAKVIRDKFCEYFNSEGEITCQQHMVEVRRK